MIFRQNTEGCDSDIRRRGKGAAWTHLAIKLTASTTKRRGGKIEERKPRTLVLTFRYELGAPAGAPSIHILKGQDWCPS